MTRLAAFLPPESVRSALVGLLPLVGGVTGALLASWLGPDVGSRHLYAAAAPIIPVMLLAIALQARVFRIEVPPTLGLDDKGIQPKIDALKAELSESRDASTSARAQLEGLKTETASLRDENDTLGSSSAEDGAALARLTNRLAAVSAQIETTDSVREDSERRLEEFATQFSRFQRFSTAVSAGWGITRVVYVAFGMALLAAGEFHALDVLARADFTARPNLVMGAIGFGFGAVFVSAVVQPTRGE